MNLRLLPIALLFVSSAALADERRYSVTSFTRVRVEGPVTVKIEAGRAPGAWADGDRQAIDRIRAESNGDLLMVGIDRTNWTGDTSNSGNARAVLHVTTPTLETLSVIGAGDVSVDRVQGARLALTLTGAGRAVVDAIDVDQLTTAVTGAGSAVLAGRARQARIRSQGEAQIDAAKLVVGDAEVLLVGAGAITLRVERAARNVLKGSGQIVIEGDPACSGSSEGSGEVRCGPPS